MYMKARNFIFTTDQPS